MDFHFGDLVLDTARRELRRAGQTVPVEPQVFDLLVFLIGNRHRVVSKDDLIAAVWGGRIVSESTLTSRINAARKAVGDSGDSQRLIRTIARKGFRFVAEIVEPADTAQAIVPADGAPLLPDRPSIAVLPFANLSGDPQEDYFADGMAEDILTGLSRHRWLFVIARNSSFTYRARAVDLRRVGQELGVRYVLEGSVRRAGGRVRFTAQLIDAVSGAHVWADRYEGPTDDLFELQDRITESIVGILEPTIHRAEIVRTRRKHPGRLDAYDYYLRALALTDGFTRESVEGMLAESLRAIALDPSLAPAFALAARAYIQRISQGWIVDLARERAEVLDLVDRGLRADRFDPLMLGTAGHCFAWFAHDLARGISHIDEAIALNPNHAHAYLQSGVVRTRAGETRRAIEHLERAMRLSPRDSRSYAIFQALALAHHVDGDAAAAAEWARRAVRHNPNYLPGWYALAASAADAVEAQAAVRHLLALDPAFSVSGLRHRYPISATERFQIVLDGLSRAGVPE